MATDGDTPEYVTKDELTSILDDALSPFKGLLGGDTDDDSTDDDDTPLKGAKFTLAEMEEYAEREVKKRTRELRAKKRETPAPVVKADDDEPKTEPKTEPVTVKPAPVGEETPIAEPKKVPRKTKWWGA